MPDTLGTVVLAAPLASHVLHVAGYADIHARGLTVVGIPWATDPAAAPIALVDWALASLADEWQQVVDQGLGNQDLTVMTPSLESTPSR